MIALAGYGLIKIRIYLKMKLSDVQLEDYQVLLNKGLDFANLRFQTLI